MGSTLGEPAECRRGRPCHATTVTGADCPACCSVPRPGQPQRKAPQGFPPIAKNCADALGSAASATAGPATALTLHMPDSWAMGRAPQREPPQAPHSVAPEARHWGRHRAPLCEAHRGLPVPVGGGSGVDRFQAGELCCTVSSQKPPVRLSAADPIEPATSPFPGIRVRLYGAGRRSGGAAGTDFGGAGPADGRKRDAGLAKGRAYRPAPCPVGLRPSSRPRERPTAGPTRGFGGGALGRRWSVGESTRCLPE
jgi:hypothetical protein